MINLTLDRIFLGSHYTIGRLDLDGKPFCDTLEDITRDLNMDGDLDDPGEEKIFGKHQYHTGVTGLRLLTAQNLKDCCR